MERVGEWFWNYAAFVIGTGELIVTLILLVAVVFTFMKKKTGKLFGLAGLGSFALMSWAVFFHLFSPLWIEVNWDWGSLFRAAVSIMILWLIFAVINRCSLIQIIKKK